MSRSPTDERSASDYESAWTSITALIEGGESWSGNERNLCYLNNRDGTFSDVSAATGLDFLDDGRSFATGDLDGDGDLDLVLKSRNAPGIRVVRNDWSAGNSIRVRVRGGSESRSAAGAVTTVVADGRRIAKVPRIGSGFLSQHSQELHFGLGSANRVEELRVRWPSGAERTWRNLAANRLYTVSEDQVRVDSTAFEAPPLGSGSQGAEQTPPPEVTSGTWLVEPLAAPAWELENLEGLTRSLTDYRGAPLALNVWATWCPPCRVELRDFQRNLEEFERAGMQLVAIAVDEPDSTAEVAAFAREERLGFPVLLADRDFVTAYNVLKRNLFNLRSDLQIPTTFLLNSDGFIERIYQGRIEAERLLRDVEFLKESKAARLARAVPFKGRFLGPTPIRDYTTLASALLDSGLPGAALPYFGAAAERTPSDAILHFNLGTALAAQGSLAAAKASFEQAVRLDPAYSEARNSLGVVLIRLGDHEPAIEQFRAAVEADPSYEKAIGNLSTAYARFGRLALAIETLESALASSPTSVALLNRLGRLHARSGALDAAQVRFDQALRAVPTDPDTLNNLALLAAQRGDFEEAMARLRDLVTAQPDFEPAYLSLAQVQVATNDPDGARATLEGLLARNPSNPEARELLERLAK